MQLLVWYLILVFVITWHQRWSSYTGYLSNTESNRSHVHWCIKSTLDVHHDGWLTLCSQSLNPVVDPVCGPPTLLTTSNVALELNLGNVASVTLVQLPGIPTWQHYVASVTLVQLPGIPTWQSHWFSCLESLPDSIMLTTDTNRFKNLLKSQLFYLAFWQLLAPLNIL